MSESQVQNNPCQSADCTQTAKLSELENFDALFPVLVEDLVEEWKKYPELTVVYERIKEVCSYNVPFGKKNRGLTVASAYTSLMDDNPTEENLQLARILGWCVEWLQAYFLVADDIMDNSITRRGKPCWYKVPNVGNIAINDSFVLEMSVYALIKKYFRDRSYYVDILELFHTVTSQTTIGQMLDLITTPPDGKISFEAYTTERYNAIVKWKTAFYSFYLPVALAMHMAEIKNPEAFDEARKILLKMGEYFQIQDDYLDCFGDPKVSGKIGTDIEDNKCSWLIVQALLRVDDGQRSLLQENYGYNDADKVEIVKSLYRELKLPEYFQEYEEESYRQLMKQIDCCKQLPKKLFISFAQKIYKRKK